MRLTAGSFRELHWHTADERAIMLDGKARVTVMNPDGTMFIDDVDKGDLWLFPAGFPHSIQGLQPNGCEFPAGVSIAPQRRYVELFFAGRALIERLLLFNVFA